MKNLISRLLALVVLLSTITNLKAQDGTMSPGLDVLGYGYDVFGHYADMKSKKKYCLFNFENHTTQYIGSDPYLVPQYVVLENISEHPIKTTEGSSISSYSKSLSATAGLEANSMFFSGSIESSYGKTQSGSTKKFYYTKMDANTKWRISFDERSLANLQSILEAQAKKDIETMEPSELFRLYGTHFIASAYLGGRLDYSSVSTITSSSSVEDIRVAVSASYAAVKANASVSSSHSKTLSNSKTVIKLKAIGGNSEFISDQMTAEQYKDWASGIEKRPVLCDFDKHSLKPIWMLASTDKRKAELEKAFDELCELHPFPAILSSASVIFSKHYGNLVIDLEGGDSKIGNPVQTWFYHGENNQQFHMVKGNNPGEYKIKTKGGLYIGIEGDATTAGAKAVILPGDNNYKSIFWKKENAENGFVYLVNVNSGLVLEIPGNINYKDAALQLGEKNGDKGQQWMIEAKSDIFPDFGKRVYDEKWSSGWTSTKFLNLNGSPYLFHYKKGSGLARNAAIIEGSNLKLNNIYDKEWSTGYTSWGSYTYGSNTYHLTLKHGDGTAHVDKYSYEGKPSNVWKDDWSSGWSHVEVFNFGKEAYFLHYKKSSGLARIGILNPYPNGNVWETTWEKDLTSFKHFEIDGKHYLFVLGKNGKAWVFGINKSGGKLVLGSIWSTTNWETGIKKSVVMEGKYGPVLFLYKAQTGKVWTLPVFSNGSIGSPWYEATWGTDWTDFEAMTKDGKTYFLHHKESGQTRINMFE